MAGIPVEITPSLNTSQVEADLRFVLANWDSATKEMKDKVNKALGGTDVKIQQTIVYEADTSGLKEAKVVNKEIYDQLDKQKKEYDKQYNSIQTSVTSLRQQLNNAKQARDAIARYTVESEAAATATGRIVVATKKVNDEWTQANQKVQALQRLLGEAGSSSFFDKIRGVFQGTGLGQLSSDIQGIVGTFQSLGIIIQQLEAAFNGLVAPIKQVQSIELTFKSINQGASSGTQALQSAAQTSQNLGVSLNTVLKGYQQLTPVITAAGGTMGDVSRITEALSSRFVAFGKSADESKRVMNAVIQAFGKGKLMSEELNQQIAEADPAFRTDLADAIGVSVMKLNDMIAAGQVTNDVLLKAIPNMGKTADIFNMMGMSATEAAMALGKGSGLGPTIEQVENKINALNSISLISFAKQFEGLIQAVLTVRGAIADLFSSFSQSGALTALGEVVGDIAKGFANLVVAASAVAEALVPILSWVAGFVTSLSQATVLSTTFGEILGTIIATGIVAWFASVAAGAISSAVAIGKAAAALGAELAKTAAAQVAQKAKIAGTVQETAATVENTAAIAAETAAVTANTAAKAANAVGGAEQLSFIDEVTGKIKATSSVQKELFDTSQYVVEGLKSTGDAAKKTGGPLASLRGGIANLANGVPILNTNLGELAKNGFRGIIIGAQEFLASLVPLLGPLALLAAAAGTVYTAVNYANKSYEASSQTTKDYASSVNALNSTLKETSDKVKDQTTEVISNQQSWDGAAKRVGGWAAGYDRFTRAIGLGSSELNSYVNDINATEEGFAKMDKAVSSTRNRIAELTPYINQNAEARKKATTLTNSLVNTLENEISTLKKRATELDSIHRKDKDEEKYRATNLAQLQSRIALQEQLLAQVQKQAQASGIVVAGMMTEEEALKKTVKLLKEKEKMIEVLNQPKINALKAAWEQEKADLEQAKQKNQEKFEAIKRGIDDAKRKEEERHRVADDALKKEVEAVKLRYDTEIERLSQIKTAISNAYQARIDQLKDKTYSERALEELNIQKLKVQAVQGETREQRLSAQAQLERIAANQKAASLEEQKKRDEAAIQAQIDAAKKAKEEELAALKKKERKEDETHQATMQALLKEANDLEKAQIAERKTEKEKEQKLAQEYGPQIKALEQEIQDAKEETKIAEIKVKEAAKDTGTEISNNTVLQQGFTAEVENSKNRIEELKTKVGELGNKIKQLPPMPSLGTRFAGGPMRAGESSYVNELGKEAFLSSSGKLSWINKPAWSIWKAPSSGTVIPAHIAAGMNIPSGGININRSTIKNVSNSVSSGSNDYRTIARALGSMNNNSVGVINNSVTISSDAPVKTASDMLVELTRIKRRRYS